MQEDIEASAFDDQLLEESRWRSEALFSDEGDEYV
ncbi:hypothetical protein SAMN05216238_10589 [Lentibacillus persicus]|uniref:Uncharacterized protein n=1 Tax=Lentibacillus persicus TaxID=640948 RepID=A0A1I1VXY1_9BACI|nr:hypothetical protein SAMN05216238_10589 [Lentibacillus persicus]